MIGMYGNIVISGPAPGHRQADDGTVAPSLSSLPEALERSARFTEEMGSSQGPKFLSHFLGVPEPVVRPEDAHEPPDHECVQDAEHEVARLGHRGLHLPPRRLGTGRVLLIPVAALADLEVQLRVVRDDAVHLGAYGPLHPRLLVDGPGVCYLLITCYGS